MDGRINIQADGQIDRYVSSEEEGGEGQREMGRGMDGSRAYIDGLCPRQGACV